MLSWVELPYLWDPREEKEEEQLPTALCSPQAEEEGGLPAASLYRDGSVLPSGGKSVYCNGCFTARSRRFRFEWKGL